MANIKSSKKRARQALKKQKQNVTRRSALKTVIKKVLTTLASTESAENVTKVLREAESKISRARGKGLLHKKTAQRKISRLATRVAAAQKANASK